MTTAEDLRLPCRHCGARYDATLVKQSCPVCRTPVNSALSSLGGARTEDTRMLLIVAMATVANVLVLAVLAIALFHG